MAFAALAPLAAATFPPTTPGVASANYETRTVCAAPKTPVPVPVVVPTTTCAVGMTGADVWCALVSATTAQCGGSSNWSGRGYSPILLDGSAGYYGGSTMSWCPPGGFCRSYGVSWPLKSCMWQAIVQPEGCGSAPNNVWDYPGWSTTGNMTIAPGQCVSASIDAWVWVQTADQLALSPLPRATSFFDVVVDSGEVCA
ncbi:MAG: hypothetical protein ACYDCK_04515 [Thermoplasmatota archaeon]